MIFQMKRAALNVIILILIATFFPLSTFAQEALTNDTIRSLDAVSEVSEDVPVDEQIVVIYKEASENNIEKLTLDETAIAAGTKISEYVDVIQPETGQSSDALIAEIEQDEAVEAVGYDSVLETTALPNDPSIQNGIEWYFEHIGAGTTWNRLMNPETVKVAVIDSGVNTTHEDLVGRTEAGKDYFDTTASSVTDISGHGTAVAGCLAATANNGIGIAGVAGSAAVEVVPCRVGGTYRNDKILRVSATAAALKEISQRSDIQIVNMSFGTQKDNNILKEAIESTAAAGKVMVASAGNDGAAVASYPASYDGVISVGSIGEDNEKSSFSNYNTKVDLCAPGENIITTDTSGDYSSVSGTSFSTPIVSGACAVLLAANPNLTPIEVENLLKETALDLGAEGRDDSYGEGLIQLDKALEKVEGQSQSQAKVIYTTHVQDEGWQQRVSDGAESGTTGLARRLEGIKIEVSGASDLGIVYRTHVEDYGWQNWQQQGEISGTTGKSKRLEAIQIQLTGTEAENYDVYYSVHAEDYGWLDWASNGQAAGSEGQSKRLEAIKIVIVPKGTGTYTTTRPFVSAYGDGNIRYQTHIQDIGWQTYKNDGTLSGTTGESKRLEGIRLSASANLPEGSVMYKTHVQDIGWQGWQSDGALSGTSGRALRLEAIQVKLTGELEKQYDIYYQVHIQNFGWSGWAKNGESAGSEGYAYRLEGIRISLVEKGKTPPGETENTFWKK